MKKQILLPALLLLGFTSLMSCKKDNDDAINPSTTACKLDHAINVGNDDSLQLTYDSEDRVIKRQTFDENGNSKSYTLYTYSSGRIVQKDYNSSSDLTLQTNYYLNSNNNVSYSVNFVDGAENDTTRYSYNSDKNNTRRVIKHTTSFLGISTSTYDTIWYTYTAGNLTKIEKKMSGANLQTTIYSYGSEDATKSEFLVPGQDFSFIKNIYGDNSKKLPTSITTGDDTYTFIYELNSDGYVKRYKIMEGATTSSDQKLYYTCK